MFQDEVLGAVFGDNFAMIHNGYASTKGFRFFHIVSGENDGFDTAGVLR